MPGEKAVKVSVMQAFGREFIRYEMAAPHKVGHVTVPLDKAHEIIIGTNRAIIALAESRKKAVEGEAEKAEISS